LGGDHADRQTCHGLRFENLPAGSTQLYTDEWQSYRGSHPAHATVRHGVHEWARNDDGDGQRGVHKQYLHLYVATYEAMVNSKRITPELIRRMCLSGLSEHTGYT
jgi:hypothetical protein